MLIQINTYILVMVLDSNCGQNFHYLTVARVKMPLFLELVWAHLRISIIRRRYFNSWKRSNTRIIDTTLTAEAQYSINCPRSNRAFYLSLHYNGSNSFLLVNATKINQFKVKDSEIKKYPLCLRNISGDFSASNMKETELNGYV